MSTVVFTSLLTKPFVYVRRIYSNTLDFTRITYRTTPNEVAFLEEVANNGDTKSVSETIHLLFSDCQRMGIDGFGDNTERPKQALPGRIQGYSGGIDAKHGRLVQPNYCYPQELLTSTQLLLAALFGKVREQESRIAFLEQQIALQGMAAITQYYPHFPNPNAGRQEDFMDWATGCVGKIAAFRNSLRSFGLY